MTTLAIIAPGAMGSALAARAVEHGARVLTSIDGRSDATARRGRDAGMLPTDDDRIVGEADFLMSVVPPSQALALAERFRPAFDRAGRRPVYIDANAVSPATVRRIAAAIGDDHRFVDACIIGQPPQPGTVSPAIYACGLADAQLRTLQLLGLDVRALPGPVGQASALKMCYGGITKGLSALGSAMKAAAAREGLSTMLDRELAMSASGIAGFLDAKLPTIQAKAYRWVGEMDEVSAFLGAGNASAIYDRIARYFEDDGQDGG